MVGPLSIYYLSYMYMNIFPQICLSIENQCSWWLRYFGASWKNREISFNYMTTANRFLCSLSSAICITIFWIYIKITGYKETIIINENENEVDGKFSMDVFWWEIDTHLKRWASEILNRKSSCYVIILADDIGPKSSLIYCHRIWQCYWRKEIYPRVVATLNSVGNFMGARTILAFGFFYRKG